MELLKYLSDIYLVMFKSTIGAMLAHKQLVIAALAISGVALSPMLMTVNVAEATHTDISISRTIEIPCEPYCVRPPVLVEGIDRTAGPVHIQIQFRFT